jgi:hypothetical protein
MEHHYTCDLPTFLHPTMGEKMDRGNDILKAHVGDTETMLIRQTRRGCEARNHFKVFVGGSQIADGLEDADCCCRLCCPQIRPFTMVVKVRPKHVVGMGRIIVLESLLHNDGTEGEGFQGTVVNLVGPYWNVVQPLSTAKHLITKQYSSATGSQHRGRDDHHRPSISLLFWHVQVLLLPGGYCYIWWTATWKHEGRLFRFRAFLPDQGAGWQSYLQGPPSNMLQRFMYRLVHRRKSMLRRGLS